MSEQPSSAISSGSSGVWRQENGWLGCAAGAIGPGEALSFADVKADPYAKAATGNNEDTFSSSSFHIHLTLVKVFRRMQ